MTTSSPNIDASWTMLPSGAITRLCPCEPVRSSFAGALAWTTYTVFSTALAWICAR